ncbi:MAG: hypothetical protein M9897_08805 [Brumimicrobium sp.]|nr:hypothetical protein [Brumimicrobium sp.]
MKKMKLMQITKMKVAAVQNLDKIIGGAPVTTGGCTPYITQNCISNDGKCTIRTNGCCDNV